MFEVDALAFEYGKRPARKPDLRVHQRFFKEYDGKIFLSRNARHDVAVRRIFFGRQDERARVVRAECILDLDRDIPFTHGEDRFRVQNVRPHIGQFAQFFERDDLDLFGALHDARIAGEEAAHVRPVLIQVGIHRARHDRAADVAPAARKRFDLPVRARTVKTGDHGMFCRRKARLDERVRSLFVEGALFIEKDDVFRVHKFPAEQNRDDARVQVFPARRRKIRAAARRDVRLRPVQNRRDVEIQPEFGDDGKKSLPDLRERFPAAVFAAALFETFVQKVCDLDVVRIALAGCGHNGELSRRVGKDDLRRPPDIVTVREGSPPEFAYRHIHFLTISLPSM